jgi:hypothetical protein
MLFEEFLSSSIFKYFIFPIGSALLGIAIKYVARNDQYAKFKKEDLAVGLELIRTACLMYVVLTTDRAISLLGVNEELAEVLANPNLDATRASLLQAQAQELTSKISSAGWSIALMFLALWAVSTIVRKWGWKSETEMKPIPGIAIPFSLGILSLIVVMLGASK